MSNVKKTELVYLLLCSVLMLVSSCPTLLKVTSKYEEN